MLRIKFIISSIICSFLFGLILGCKKPSAIFSYFIPENTNPQNQDPANANAVLDFSLAGNTNGYGSLRTDGIADFGLVLKSLSKLDLFQIELNDLMSTEFDKITVIGNDIELPSNVVLPKQRERFILSINLDKPNYKVKYKTNEPQNLVLVHGQFPFEDVVNAFRNDQPLLKLADKFNMLSYSQYSFENPKSLSLISLDLTAGKNQFSDIVNISSPKNFNADYSFVVVSLDKSEEAKPNNFTNLVNQFISPSATKDISFYLPHNLTVLTPDKTKNLKVSSRNAFLFSGLIHESFADSASKNINRHRMSFQINQIQNWNSEILGFVDNLNYQSSQLTFIPPQNININQQGLFYSVYEIDPKFGEILVHQNYDLNQWQTKIDLSYFETIKKPSASYRIDLFLLGSKNSQIPRNFTELIEHSEFVTRNSIYL